MNINEAARKATASSIAKNNQPGLKMVLPGSHKFVAHDKTTDASLITAYIDMIINTVQGELVKVNMLNKQLRKNKFNDVAKPVTQAMVSLGKAMDVLDAAKKAATK